MSVTRRFLCCRPTSSDKAASFEKDIPESLVQRSDFLKLAVNNADDEDDGPVTLVLPSEIDNESLDAWLQLNESAAQASHIDSHQTDKSCPDILIQALRVSDFFADDVSLNIVYKRIACYLFCTQHVQECTNLQPRKRQKLSITNESETYKPVSRSVQKLRTANKKILHHIPPHVALSILSKGGFLACIRCLPPAYHPLAIEAHHSEVMKHQTLSLTRERLSCDDSVRLDVFTAVATHSQLTSLHLHGYWISQCKPVIQRRLCAMLASLGSLHELRFPDGVNSATVSVLIHSASALTSLKLLDISGDTDSISMQAQTLPAQELNILLHSLRELPELRSLLLHAFKRDSDEIVEFCAALKHLTNLTKLDLSSCFLRVADKGHCYGGSRYSKQVGDGLRVTQRLGTALKRLKRLEHLDLSKSFPRDYIEPVLDAIAGLTKLTTLTLQDMNTMACMRYDFPHNVPMNIGYGKRLVPMLQRVVQLQSLNLSGYPLFDDIWTGFGSALSHLRQLTMLQLEHVANQEEFWDTVFGVHVSALDNLKVISLSSNYTITNQNVWAVGKALTQLPSLESLWMCSCGFKREGAVALAEHLKSLTGLTQLALKDNRIGPQGAKAIADSLKLLPNILAVRFTFKCIGGEGADCIRSALKTSLGEEWEAKMQYHCGIEPSFLGQDWEPSETEHDDHDDGLHNEIHHWNAAEVAGLFQQAQVPQLHIALHWFQAMVMEAMI